MPYLFRPGFQEFRSLDCFVFYNLSLQKRYFVLNVDIANTRPYAMFRSVSRDVEPRDVESNGMHLCIVSVGSAIRLFLCEAL